MARVHQSARKLRNFLLRDDRGINPIPINASAGIGNSSENKVFGRIAFAVGLTVVNVSVALPLLPLTVTGLVFPNEQEGAGVTVGEMLQESVTVPAYPFAEETVIVDCADPPGLIVPWLGAPAERE